MGDHGDLPAVRRQRHLLEVRLAEPAIAARGWRASKRDGDTGRLAGLQVELPNLEVTFEDDAGAIEGDRRKENPTICEVGDLTGLWVGDRQAPEVFDAALIAHIEEGFAVRRP